MKNIEDFFFKETKDLLNDELIDMLVIYYDLMNDTLILDDIPEELKLNYKDVENHFLELKAELLKRLGEDGLDNYKRSDFLS